MDGSGLVAPDHKDHQKATTEDSCEVGDPSTDKVGSQSGCMGLHKTVNSSTATEELKSTKAAALAVLLLQQPHQLHMP